MFKRVIRIDSWAVKILGSKDMEETSSLMTIGSW